MILEVSKEYEDIKFAIYNLDANLQVEDISNGIRLVTDEHVYTTFDEVLGVLLEKYEPSKKSKEVKRIRQSNEQQPIKVTFSSLISLYKYFKDMLVSSTLENAGYIESLLKLIAAEYLFFYTMYLQVGKIVEINTVEGSDKLYMETVDTGERLQILSGLREFYTKEQLIGRNFVFITNIKTSKIKGFESFGMILCVKDDSNVEAIEIDSDVEKGERLVLELPNIITDYKIGKIDLKKSMYNKIFANLSVKNKFLEYNGVKLKVGDNFVRTKTPNGIVG